MKQPVNRFLALALFLALGPCLVFAEPPAQDNPPVPAPAPRREDPLMPLLQRQRDLTAAHRAGFERDMAALLAGEHGAATVDRLAEEVAGFPPPLTPEQTEKLNLLTRFLDIQAAEQDRNFQGGRAGAIVPRAGTPGPRAGPEPENWTDRLLAPAPAQPRAQTAASRLLAGARPVGEQSILPQVTIPVRGFSPAPPLPGASDRLPQLYTPPPSVSPFGSRIPAALSGEFNPNRLPPRNPTESYAQYLDRLPLATLQAYSHFARGRREDLASQALARGPSAALILPERGRTNLAQQQVTARWMDGHIDSALGRRQEAVMGLVAGIEAGRGVSPQTLSRLEPAQLSDLERVLDARAGRPPVGGLMPAGSPAEGARGAIWRELLDRAAPAQADPRLGAPSSWLGLENEELSRRLAALGSNPAQAARNVWAHLQGAQGGLGSGGSGDGRRDYYRLQSQLDRIAAGPVQTRAQELAGRADALITQAYGRVGGEQFQAGMTDLRTLRESAAAALRETPDAQGLPLASAQRQRLQSLVRRIDDAEHFLGRVPQVASVPYTHGNPLAGLHQAVPPGASITGGAVYRVSDARAGAAGVQHQHLMLDVTYRDADGREQTASWPFGYFNNASTERDSWVNRPPEVTGERLRTLRPNEVFTAYGSLLHSQQVSNQLFQSGQVSWTLLGEGNNLGGWQYTGLPWLAAQVTGGVNRIGGGGPTVNCRDVACIFSDRLSGDLPRRSR